jgi:hypothetical protein
MTADESEPDLSAFQLEVARLFSPCLPARSLLKKGRRSWRVCRLCVR